MKLKHLSSQALLIVFVSVNSARADDGVACPFRKGTPISLNGNYLICDANYSNAVSGLIDNLKKPPLKCNTKVCTGSAFWDLSFTSDDVKNLDNATTSGCQEHAPIKNSHGEEITEAECRSTIRGTDASPRVCWFVKVSGTKAQNWQCLDKSATEQIFEF